MDNLQLFRFGERNVEVILVNNEPLFNARHVGICLEIANIRDTIKEFDDDEAVKLTNEYISTCSIVGNTDNRKLHNTGELFFTEAIEKENKCHI